MTRVAGAMPAGLLLLVLAPARAAEYVTPPIMPVPTAWQGRSQAVVRVLDKLDAHVETLTLKAGDTGSYKSLSVTVRSCMDRPDGMPQDSGAFLEIRDQRGTLPSFSGWSFSGEPSVGVFESPVYGVQLVTCQGDLVAPLAPPLPPPVPPPASMQPDAPDVAASAGTDGQVNGPGATTPDAASPETAPPNADGSPADAPDQAPSGQGAPPSSTSIDGSAGAQPDPVYPAGRPPAQPPS